MTRRTTKQLNAISRSYTQKYMTESICNVLIGTSCIIMYIIFFCYLIQAFTGFNPLWLLGGII